MSWTKINESTRTLLYCVTVFGMVAIALWFGASSNTVTAGDKPGDSAAPQATFPGTGTGAIPDGLSGTPPQFGAPLVISFAVSGVSGPVTSVTADVTLTHTWVGDVDMVLRAPGGTPSLVLVSRIGVQTATSFGSANDYSGTYAFSDAAAGANIWTAAATNPVPPGTYRTTAPGQAGQTNPPPVTSLNTTFGGLTPAQANGTWTLSIRDAASADVGSVSAANLTVNPTGVVIPTDAPQDFNGDGKSDYVVVRNVGGGPSGQIRWFYNTNGTGAPTVALDWGLNGDLFVTEDFDGDLKDDITVWRSIDTGGSKFYILQSLTNTVRIDTFGQSGDVAKVVGDYDGDGKADVAVYRSGAAAGDGSTWFYRGSLANPSGNITYVPWGQNGDFEAPGDYDGDGKNDFVVQRNGGGGQARFWRRFATGATDTVVFGTPTDNIAPGDYDGDGKTDIMVYRGIGGQLNWFYLSSLNGSINQFVYGISATDFSAQGDYDGDGKTDITVWRPDLDPTQNFFYSLNSSNGATQIFELGQNGDYPVANWNRH
jgi:subtilisin-like proprotein convertase family protein